MSSTIAAIATASGVGALGIVRLSGPDSFRTASLFFKSTPSIEEAEPWRVLFGRILDSDSFIDQAVAVKYGAPKSYTGEDMVEIIAHGSPLILRRIFELACRAGAVPAEPGEFTARAFRNGKMDLAQAEAVCGMIRSSSFRSLKLHARVVSGELSRQITACRDLLIEAMANLDVLLDHPDEPEITDDFSPSAVLSRLERVREILERMAVDFQSVRKVREGSVWVIAGAPNAGKSTLFNRMLSKDRAIVSPVPGTTRDTLEEYLELDGHLIRLVDTAGLRDTQDVIEGLGVGRTRNALEKADGILWVLDGHSDSSMRSSLLNLNQWNQDDKRPIIVAWNKSDLPGFSRRPLAYPVFAQADISAATGAGLDELRRLLLKALDQSAPLSEDATILEERQAQCVLSASQAVQQAQARVREALWELACCEVRQAVLELDSILGGGDIAEEVLSKIFSKFCVGK